MARTPSLDTLRTFVVAAHHLSFTEAANRLDLTQSAVSHRIRGLEQQLGLALFKRLTPLLDLRPEGIDIAIRFGRPPHPGYTVTRLMGDCVLPVCAPALLERSGSIDSIDALLALPLLHDSATDADGSDSDWRAWLDPHGQPDAACHAGRYFSEASRLIDAAALGLGVALARASRIADQMARGALVCPLRRTAPTAFAYYLLGLLEVVERPKIALFHDLLLAEAAMTETFTHSIEQKLAGTP